MQRESPSPFPPLCVIWWTEVTAQTLGLVGVHCHLSGWSWCPKPSERSHRIFSLGTQTSSVLVPKQIFFNTLDTETGYRL